MSNYTDYEGYLPGMNLYAKEQPLNTGTWATGVVAYVENGATGSYAATLDNTKAYAIYKRLGGSPASSDLRIGSVAAWPVQNMTVLPLSENQLAVVADSVWRVSTGSRPTLVVSLVDSTGAAINLTGRTLRMDFEDQQGTDVASIADGSISRTGNQYTITLPAAVTASTRTLRRTLWDITNTPIEVDLSRGTVVVSYAAKAG